MDSEFTAILQKLVAEQGRETLLNPYKCKAFLADYTRGEYKKESRLFLQALDAGVQKAIDTAENIAICKKQQIRMLQEDYSLGEKAAVDVVDTLALVLRGDSAKTIVPKKDAAEKQAKEATVKKLGVKKMVVGKAVVEKLIVKKPTAKNPVTKEPSSMKLTVIKPVVKKNSVQIKREKLDLAEIRKINEKYITCINASSDHTAGLKADGTVVAVGNNDFGRCNTGSWRGIVAVSAGSAHTVGLKADGTVVAVGDNYFGQCNTRSWRDIVVISAHNTVGLKTDGTVVAVGYNEYGQCDIGSWQEIVAIATGFVHTVGLKADGTVVAVGFDYHGRCDTGSWRDIVAVSAGFAHTVGLRADGTVVAIGENKDGRCDIGSWRDIGPVPEELISKWRQWKKQGLCQYCGGHLGLFKKCKSCGEKN